MTAKNNEDPQIGLSALKVPANGLILLFVLSRACKSHRPGDTFSRSIETLVSSSEGGDHSLDFFEFNFQIS